MYIEQMYTDCLAEAAYYIESDGEAAIIDPIRETEPYLNKLKLRGAKLKYVFETHFHADFVSGHIDLAKKTNSQIIFGPEANTGYEVHNAVDGEVFRVGKLTITALHTPGHTPESTCYLLKDETGKDHCIFTGDTLFVGDVGRPDLLDGKMTKEELGAMMYESLNHKIKPLADDVIVYPAHGPGSSCGKNIGQETFSTIGIQKKTNYALQEMSKEEFIEKVTEGLKPPPQYFFTDAMINKNGYSAFDDVMKRNLRALSLNEFRNTLGDETIILDTRHPDEFGKGFIPGSINIGLNGSFAVWAGTLLDVNETLVVVADEGKEEEAIIRLARVGYENVSGFLSGGFNTWKEAELEIDRVHSISATEAKQIIEEGDQNIFDVRKQSEYESGHFLGVEHLCLSAVPEKVNELNSEETYYLHCLSGYRSMVASSILMQKGFKNVINIEGGFNALATTGMKIEVLENAQC